jgi:hypothetical protein
MVNKDEAPTLAAMFESGEISTIDLDCPPGSPRPGDLIGGVIEGLDI